MSTEIAVHNRDSFSGAKVSFCKIETPENFEREVSFALQVINSNKTLAKCSSDSLLRAVINIANTGLTLNPALKFAYLIPRYTKNVGWEAHLEPSYSGLCKLITDTGSVTNIYAHPVYKGDAFTIGLGTSPAITHEPKFESEDIEKFYAVGKLPDGSAQIEVMTVDAVNAIRATSESYKAFIDPKKPYVSSCIWETYYGEMGRKTVIKRLQKYLPKSERWDKVSQAVELTNIEYQASLQQIQYIESLLDTANISPEHKAQIWGLCNTYSSDTAAETISYLKDNQLNPITHGNPSKTEVGKEMKRIQNETE